jgi:hypothetical protein
VKIMSSRPRWRGEAMRAAHMANAARFAANVLPYHHDLTLDKVATANGGRWTHVQIRQILNRAANRK